MGEMPDEHINEILSYLKAWPFALMQQALKQWRVGDALTRYANGWRSFDGEQGDVPPGFDWRMIGTKMQIRPSFRRDMELRQAAEANVAQSKVPGKKRTDLSTAPVDGLACPKCADKLFKEGICPGCEDGRRGFKVRLLCGNCDFTMLL